MPDFSLITYKKKQKIIWLLTPPHGHHFGSFLLRHHRVTSPLDLSRSACPCRIHPAYPRPLGLWDVPGRAASMRWPSFGKGDGARWDETFIQKMWGWYEMRFTHMFRYSSNFFWMIFPQRITHGRQMRWYFLRHSGTKMIAMVFTM